MLRWSIMFILNISLPSLSFDSKYLVLSWIVSNLIAAYIKD